MDEVEGVRKLGFRKWYERQLIEGHAYLVSCFLCAILALTAIEAFGDREHGPRPVSMLLLCAAGCAAGAFAWNRYRSTLERAERVGLRATCPSCQAYGQFKITEARPRPYDPQGSPQHPELRVRCQKCGGEWTI